MARGTGQRGGFERDLETDIEQEMRRSGRGHVVPREGLVGPHAQRREGLGRELASSVYGSKTTLPGSCRTHSLSPRSISATRASLPGLTVNSAYSVFGMVPPGWRIMSVWSRAVTNAQCLSRHAPRPGFNARRPS